jgi:hypothetical protein
MYIYLPFNFIFHWWWCVFCESLLQLSSTLIIMILIYINSSVTYKLQIHLFVSFVLIHKYYVINLISKVWSSLKACFLIFTINNSKIMICDREMYLLYITCICDNNPPAIYMYLYIYICIYMYKHIHIYKHI